MKFLSLVLLMVCLNSCGSKSSAVPTPAGGNQSLMAQSYEFKINECTTDFHEFKGDTIQEVMVPLCTTLQDEDKNNRCAQSKRKEFFEKSCTGQTWSPFYTETAQEENETSAGEEQIPTKIKFNNLMVDNATINEGLSNEDEELSQEMIEEFTDCNISYFGSKCEGKFYYGGAVNRRTRYIDGKEYLTANIKSANQDYELILLLYVDPNRTDLKSTVHVYKSKSLSFDYQEITPFIEDTENNIHLMDLDVTMAQPNNILDRLKNPRNIRQLTQAVTLFFESSLQRQEHEQLVASNFDAFKEVILNSSDVFYQFKVLKTLDDFKFSPITSEKLLPLYEVFKDSSDEDLRNFSIINLFITDPNNSPFRPEIFSALLSSNSYIIDMAYSAISFLDLTLDEQIQIISSYVPNYKLFSKEIENLLYPITITEDHLAAIEDLISQDNAKYLRFAASLLNNMNSDKATKALISMLSNDNSYFRQEVTEYINTKPINDNVIPDVISLFNSETSSNRNLAAILLGKFKSAEALSALESQLIVEENSNIKKEIEKAIQFQKMP